MQYSGFMLNQLQTPLPEAWSALLAEQLDGAEATVTQVTAEKVSPQLTRYALLLAGQPEPITCLAQYTGALEARFYQTLGVRLAFLTPRCWFSYVGTGSSWVVVEEYPAARPLHDWTPADVDDAVGDLARMHAANWNLDWEVLDYGWLPTWFSPQSWSWQQRAAWPVHLSSQAVLQAGSLAPRLAQAALGLEQWAQWKGWDALFPEGVLQALGDLLDDPAPLLYPLRDLPTTVIHGAPVLPRWRATPLGRRWLLSWRSVRLGPGVLDLMGLLESAAAHLLTPPPHPSEHWNAWEEQWVDTYILRLASELGPGVDMRAVRRALPAARCLHFILYWWAQLNKWLHLTQTRPPMRRAQPPWLVEMGQLSGPLAARWRATLATGAQRFLRAYYQL